MSTGDLDLDAITATIVGGAKPGTHWPDCYLDHSGYDAVVALVSEVRRLRAERAAARAAAWDAAWDAITALTRSLVTTSAERDRLRDGIRAHGYGIAADTPQERLERNRRLWALLDDNEENE